MWELACSALLFHGTFLYFTSLCLTLQGPALSAPLFHCTFLYFTMLDIARAYIVCSPLRASVNLRRCACYTLATNTSYYNFVLSGHFLPITTMTTLPSLNTFFSDVYCQNVTFAPPTRTTYKTDYRNFDIYIFVLAGYFFFQPIPDIVMMINMLQTLFKISIYNLDVSLFCLYP